MKKSMIYRFIGLFAVVLTIMVACTEDIVDIRLDANLTTSEVLDVQSGQATVIGFVIAEGSGITERGVCYGTAPEPTVDDNKAVYDTTVDGATFSVTIMGLDYATMYYAKAYVVTGSGTLYGKELSFTTLAEVPIVTTTALADISYTTATSGGEVTDAKGSEVTARGVCWSTSEAPTVNDSKTTDGDGLGTFTSSISGLTEGATYYVRAYATNTAGTGYGEELTFTTLVPQSRTWNIPGNYVAGSYPGSALADWSPDKSPQIRSIDSAPDNLEGYVYMAVGSNEWKVATTTSWDDTNYGGVGGVLDAGSPNIANGNGYYKINVDASALTYTALNTDWGLIGSATPGGWGADTDLVYNAQLQKWIGGMSLVAGDIKFRANDSWDAPDPNYGSVNADGNIDTENDNNIPVATPGDYAITLDLSQPLAYTYRADMWGLIGDATPDAWNSDQDMTYDAPNGEFTVTVDLTVGEIKFRANDDWAYALGGDLGALSSSGGNIAISVAGNYTVTLDPWNMVATLTMN